MENTKPRVEIIKIGDESLSNWKFGNMDGKSAWLPSELKNIARVTTTLSIQGGATNDLSSTKPFCY